MPFTKVVAVAELLVPLGSVLPETATLAVLEIFPIVEGLTLTITEIVAVPFLAMLPRLQVITPLVWLHVGAPGVTDWNETPGGRELVTVTFVASEGPLLSNAKRISQIVSLVSPGPGRRSW